MNPGSPGLAEVALGDTVSALVGSVQRWHKALGVGCHSFAGSALLLCSSAQTGPCPCKPDSSFLKVLQKLSLLWVSLQACGERGMRETGMTPNSMG